MKLPTRMIPQVGLALLAGNACAQKPNIVYILADDLGYHEISCNGQDKFATPNIDKLAREGLSFTQHYAGSPVSAPSRCVLLTGLHTGHSYIRDNQEIGKWEDFTGQLPIPDSSFTLAELLKEKGYRTACIGKWGLGFNNTPGSPLNQGFDYFYGYLCQRQAHNYYPEYLWQNHDKMALDNPPITIHGKFEGNPADSTAYLKYSGKVYSQDLLTAEALQYIHENKKHPFFLFLTYTIPHLSLQAPYSEIQKVKGSYPDTPYTGENGYVPCWSPRATYAAMIMLLDSYVGLIMEGLKEQGLDENTIVFFSSDNGATFPTGGADVAYFASNKPFRGFKTQLYEGGIHVPLIVRWKDKIRPGGKADLICGFQDMMPTLAEITQSKAPRSTDGISILPALLGKKNQPQHEYLYWEYHSFGGSQAVRMGKWKAVLKNTKSKQDLKTELYNLEEDPAETIDLSLKYPDVLEKLEKVFQKRTPSPIEEWNF
ncbi:MAG TPA: arylsulfatase [bacterium]|nr:arylsulfatase [bacterium]